jgi:hypothetical protein
MTDWTLLSNTAVGVGGLPSGATVTALRDNPIAIAEGAPGAPRITNAAFDNGVIGAEKFQVGTTETDWVSGRIIAQGVGAVGSYASAFIFFPGSTDVPVGGTKAGSALRYENDEVPYVALLGTWRCMARSTISSGATLWLRIS